MIKKVLSLLAVMTMCLSLTACSKAEIKEKEQVIGVSLANMSEQWRLVLKEELEEEAAKYDNITLIISDAAGNTEKQIEDVNRLMEYGIDLLIISPIDTKALSPVVSSFYSKIPVIVMDRVVEGYDYSLFIGPDNELIGLQEASKVLELMNERNLRGTVLELRSENLASDERSEAFRSIMNKRKLTTMNLLIPEATRDFAEDNLINFSKYANNIKAIFAHNDYMAYGARLALEKLGREDVIIVGLDGYPGAGGGLEMIKNGIIDATVSCPTGGVEAIRYAAAILDGESGIPKKVLLRSTVIDSLNIDEEKETVKVEGGKIRVGYAQIREDSSWRKANTDSIIKAAKEFNIDLDIKYSETSLEEQIEQVREFIKDDVDVILLSPFVEDGWDQVLKEAKDAGIPVILSDRSVSSKEDMYTSFVGGDFEEEGRKCGEWMLSDMGSGTARIMELQGSKGSTPASLRSKGFYESFKDNPNCEVVYSTYADFNKDMGRLVLSEYIKENGLDIDYIFAHNDDMALGAMEAVEAAGYKPGVDVKIMSVDGTKDALKMVKKGKLSCVSECNPLLGPVLMKAVTDLCEGEELPLTIVSNETVFTKNTDKSLFKGRKY